MAVTCAQNLLTRFIGVIFLLSSTLVWANDKGSLVVVEEARHHALIEEVALSGTVVSPRSAQLSTEVSGLVKSIAVEIGDTVQAGDGLLHIESRLAELTLASTKAQTLQAEKTLADGKRRLANARALSKKQTISANELDSLTAEVEIAQAELQEFIAREQHQQSLVERHQLKAPFAGVVSKRMIEIGEWVQPNAPVLRLVALNDLRVDFAVPQSVYPKLTQATTVSIKLDALPHRSFQGEIERVIPVTDPKIRSFMIRTKLQDPAIRLSPGMSASAILKIDSGDDAVVISRDALMRYPDGRVTVWVVRDEDGKASVTEKQVKTGLGFNGRMAITSGLLAGELVVVQGNESLREGQAVSIKPLEK